MEKFYVSEYQYYETWHPAEGGIWLGGKELLKSAEFTNKQEALEYLKNKFEAACTCFNITEDQILTDIKDYGYIKTIDNAEVVICFVYNESECLFENYSEDEDTGREFEDYNSWLSVEPKDSGSKERYSYIPESKEGLHAYIPLYC